MKKSLSLLLYFVAVSFSSRAQWMDTIANALNGKKALDFRFESRNSFVDNERIEIQSVKFGITFGKKISAGLGFSWLSTPIVNSLSIYDSELKIDTFVNNTLKMRYACTYVDFIFYKSKRWQYSIPTQFGIGRTGMSYTYKGINIAYPKRVIVLYEPGVNVKYKILSWLGLGANIGYRIVLKNKKVSENKFNSPVYSAGIVIYWDKLLMAIFPKNQKIQDKFGPDKW